MSVTKRKGEWAYRSTVAGVGLCKTLLQTRGDVSWQIASTPSGSIITDDIFS